MATLTPARRSELRSQAHTLVPVVIIGDKGLTDEVVAEIDRSLKAHELIKVRAATNDRDARAAWMEEICARLEAHPVQAIGKVLVIYRENFDKPRERREAGGGSPEKPQVRKRRSRDSSRLSPPDPRSSTTRTVRPRSRTTSPPRESGPRRRRRSTSR